MIIISLLKGVKKRTFKHPSNDGKNSGNLRACRTMPYLITLHQKEKKALRELTGFFSKLKASAVSTKY